MGNCFGSEALAADPSPSSSIDPTNSTKSSTPGTTDKFSTGGSLSVSATSSSAGAGGFPADFSNDTCFNGELLPASNLKVYTFADLKSCTRNFKPDMILGVGGFGTVYKGWVDGKTLMPAKLRTGIMVAIKKLKEESMQGYAEWQSEVTFLGRLSHPNLVKLLGYCLEDKELLLVYEFMQRGSLENHLFRRNKEPLSWEIRLKIALGAARGLAFLHSPDSTEDKQIIYRDFKASNILLDGNYHAKLSDFGLAKLGPSDGQSHVTTRIMGTHGYAAPEYLATGHLYVKSDVYGFGVVLLEMLTGLRALNKSRPPDQINLVEWMKPILYKKRKVKTIIDQRLEGQYSSKAVAQAAQLCLNCLELEPRKRPSMQQVVENLEHIAAIAKPKGSENGTSHSNHISRSPRSHHQSPHAYNGR